MLCTFFLRKSTQTPSDFLLWSGLFHFWLVWVSLLFHCAMFSSWECLAFFPLLSLPSPPSPFFIILSCPLGAAWYKHSFLQPWAYSAAACSPLVQAPWGKAESTVVRDGTGTLLLGASDWSILGGWQPEGGWQEQQKWSQISAHTSQPSSTSLCMLPVMFWC